MKRLKKLLYEKNFLIRLGNYFVIFPGSLLFLISITIPILLLPRDMWDGVIIAFAKEQNNYEGIFTYFMESNWILQYPLSILVIELSKLFDMDYKDMNAIFSFITFVFFLNESRIFSRKLLRLSKFENTILILLISTFPTWGVLFSSIMTFHLFCMFTGLLSIRLIHSDKVFYVILGFLLLIFSLNFQSLLSFLPVLSFMYDTMNSKDTSNNILKCFSKKTSLVLLSSFFVYILLHVFYPPTGLYENYNSLSIFSLSGLIKIGLSSILYFTFLIPFILSMGLFLLFKILFPRMATSFKIENIDYSLTLSLIVLSFSSIFPYMMVGKSTNLFEFDWGIRQAFPLSIPISLFIVHILKSIHLNNKFFLGGHIFILILLNFFILSFNTIKKINREIFLSKLKVELSKKKELISSGGVVEILSRDIPSPVPRSYELNYLMYTSLGHFKNWWIIGNYENENYEIPEIILKNKSYQTKYIFEYNPQDRINRTVIYIKSENFIGFKNEIKNLFYPNNSTVEINNIVPIKIK